LATSRTGGADQQAFEDKKGISPDQFIGLGIFFAVPIKVKGEIRK